MPRRTAPSPRSASPVHGSRIRGGPPRGTTAAGSPSNITTSSAHESSSRIPIHNVVGVRRPGHGTVGRPIKIQVNCFPVDVPSMTIYQYHVDIKPSMLPARVNMDIMRRVELDNPEIFTKSMAYDGRMIAYSVIALPLLPPFQTTLAPVIGGTAAAPGIPQPMVYHLALTRAAEINTAVLHRYIAGQHGRDNVISASLNAYNTIVKMEARLRYPFNARSFFTPEGARQIGGGIELWRGFFQSVRPAPDQLFLNLDIATCMMYRPGSLIALCLDFFDRMDLLQGNQFAEFLSPNQMDERDRIRLREFLINLRVRVQVINPGKKRPIRGITDRGAGSLIFNFNGSNITVAQYFQSRDIQIQYPEIFCVELGPGGSLIPLELCDVPLGQIMRKQLPSDKTNDLVAFSTQTPSERFRVIRNGAQQLEYEQSNYGRDFGMSIDTAGGPFSLPARILPSPRLQYGPGSQQPIISPKNGKWSLVDKKLLEPVTILHWLIVTFDTRRFSPGVRDSFVRSLLEGFRSTGLTIHDMRPQISICDPQGDILRELENAGSTSMATKKSPPQLIVVILPDQGYHELYMAVKHFGDITQGVVTQCLIAGKCVSAPMQYWTNVALKVNVKLGGSNCKPLASDVPLLKDTKNPVIVMGAKVRHPAFGSIMAQPSFAAVVGSVDSMVSKYVARIALQAGRQELIDDLKAMCKEILVAHMDYKTQKEMGSMKAPRKLIFFRVGVSEDQFEQVLAQELPSIQKACQELGIEPQITFITVIKRHHIRMNPLNKAGDESGNCPAGTILDTGITNPVDFDWYLQSHAGLVGTSRPLRYVVLYDDNRFSADILQALSFALCHVCARTTRSISVPAPIHYADQVCARSKHHFAPGFTVGAVDPDLQIDAFRQAWKPIHSNQERLMYFS